MPKITDPGLIRRNTEAEEKCLVLLKEGVAYWRIARDLNKSAGWVYKVAKAHGISRLPAERNRSFSGT